MHHVVTLACGQQKNVEVSQSTDFNNYNRDI